MRAEEYLARYESMRSLEWKIVFEIYAGYAAIATVFTKLLNDFHCYRSFPVLAMVTTFIFFAAIQYLYFRIQERLIVFNESHEACMRVARSGEKNGNHVESFLKEKRLGQDSLKHQYFWTYDVQLFISTIASAGLLAYQFRRVIDYEPRAVCQHPWSRLFWLFLDLLFWLFLCLSPLIALFMRVFLEAKLSMIKERTGWLSKNSIWIYSKLFPEKEPK